MGSCLVSPVSRHVRSTQKEHIHNHMVAGWRKKEGNAATVGGGKVVHRDDFSVTLSAVQGDDRMAVLTWLHEREVEEKKR